MFFITDGYNTGPATDDEVIDQTMLIKELYGAEIYVIGNYVYFLIDYIISQSPGLTKMNSIWFYIITLGVTPEINEGHLRQMASSPVEIHSYIVQTFEHLQNVVSSITSSTGACLVPTASPPPDPSRFFALYFSHLHEDYKNSGFLQSGK